MEILVISPGDIAELKKPHPCGGKLFRIVRVGSNVRVICTTCGRDMNIERVKLEKSIKKLITSDPTSQNKGDL